MGRLACCWRTVVSVQKVTSKVTALLWVSVFGLHTAFATGPVTTGGEAKGKARAGACAVGPGLAATLLVPYFEVDLENPGGVNTLISVNNGLESPTLARMILWTDWGIPTLAFDIHLDGLDVTTISFRDLFNGFVPSTGATADLRSFPDCGTLPPYHSNPVLSQDEVDQLRADHQGVSGPLAGDCAGHPHGDGIARGYATVDVVDECCGLEGFDPVFTPMNTGHPYFADGGDSTGIAITENSLWGDVAYIDSDNSFAQGNEMVAVWADPEQFATTDIYTFYGRFSGWDGRDDRVPLPSRWGQRMLNGGPFAGGASLVVWRDVGVRTVALDCGSVPEWWPLTSLVSSLDEDAGQLTDLGSTALPLATQRLDVGTLGISYPFGWIQVDTEQSQAWVQPSLSAFGRYSASWNGIPTQFLCGTTPSAR